MNTALTPEQRADLLIAQMTLEQKVEQLSNDVRPAENPANRPPGCKFQVIGRHIQGIPELDIPTVRMTNGGTGIRGGDCLPEPTATGVPSALSAAATFNVDLATQLGDVLGDETRLAGHQVLLGPTMNLVRHAYGGRNYDYPGEDPFLSGVVSAATIRGIQAHGIHSVAKHIVGNEQETDREAGESVIPPRALHELYLLPFEMSVKDAQVASLMCAYNQLNGASACSDAELLNTTLRQQWGFQGYVITDRRALHDLAPSIKAGVDWELAHITPHYYSLDPQPASSRQGSSEGIKAALQDGSISISDIDQMLRHRYIQMFKFGQFDTNFDALFGATPDFLSHALVAREIAEQSIVLLKNQNNFLPLNPATVNSVALIGATWFAGMAKMTPLSLKGNNTNVEAPYTVTPQQGLVNVLRSLGSTATVTYETGGGTGTKTDRDKAVALAKRSDVVIVMVGDNPHEKCDRETLDLPTIPPDPNFCGWDELKPGQFDVPSPPPGKGTDQQALMKELTADPEVAQKMVVVLKTEGMVLMPWLDKVPALVEAWYPGQEDGNAVADVLFGLRNPSGKLPLTFGNSAREAAYATPEQFPGVWSPPPPWSKKEVLSPHYTEDLQVGYRWYEANNVTPLFPFGFGLSYTTFAYSGLSVATTAGQSGQPVLTVTYTIANTGTREGAEASQVYVTLPAAAGEPSKRLVGFQKVDVAPGGSQQVSVTIDSSASNHPFSYWVPQNDAPGPGWANGTWSTATGDYTISVGGSSADTPLAQTVALSGSPAPPTAPTTPPTPSGSCSSVQPGPDWVCVSGGWLPPGLAPATGTPAPSPTPPGSCTSVQPGADWVCVNGGWLPPGLQGGTTGATPTMPTGTTVPTPPPPTVSCTSVKPGPDWVCVNGGWLPPGHPGATGGSPSQ